MQNKTKEKTSMEQIQELVAGMQGTYVPQPLPQVVMPCPSCGHCPTCGRGLYPQQYPFYQPTYIGTTWGGNTPQGLM